MNDSRSCFLSLSAALLIAATSSAQGPGARSGKACCKASSTAVVQASFGSRNAVKPAPAARLFNEVCPVTGLPTSAKTPTVAYAGYSVSLCCSACIPLFAELDQARKTAFLVRFTGKNRRVAFPATASATAAGGCGDCGSGKGKAGGQCAGGECDGAGAGKGKGKGKGKLQGKGNGMCQDKAKCGGGGQGQGRKGKGKGKGRGMGRGQGQGKGMAGPGQVSCQNTGLDGRKTSLKIPASYLKRLQETLEEELYARDYYKAASKSLSGRKFGNLARAEQHHADAITSAIRFLGGTPVLEHGRKIKAPETLAEADGVCEKIELLVIKVYGELIKDCPEPALLDVFNRIQAANRRHLSAVGG